MAIQEIFVHPDCPDCTGVIAEYNDSPNSFGDAELVDVTTVEFFDAV